MWWKSKTVMVEQCGGKVEQSWWNIDGGTVTWNSVEEQRNSHGGTVEQ